MPRKRKIPVRHHHGIRDPLKQLEDKEKKLKHVTNDPPEKDAGNQMSRKFKQFKRMYDATKAGKLPKRLTAGREDFPKADGNKSKGKKGNTKKVQSAKTTSPNTIKQFHGEEDEDYLRRVNRITRESLREAQYEAKYGVRVIRNPKTGEIKVEKKAKNEIDELLKKKQKERLLAKQGKFRKNKGPKEEVDKMDPKIAKELIKQAQKDLKQDNSKVGLQEYTKDTFKFGEIVHAPPTISTIPRKAVKADTVPRPGRKSNLLLKSMLSGESKDETKTNDSLKKKKSSNLKTSATKRAELQGKRKDLPKTTRDMLEKERNKFVELYRKLKKTNQPNAT